MAIKNIFYLLSMLSERRKYQLFGLFLLMVISAIAELASLGSVLPFLTLLTNSSVKPEFQSGFPLSAYASDFLSLFPPTNYFLIVTSLFILLTVLSGVIRSLASWLNLRVTAAIGSDLSSGSFFSILNKPYDYHLRENTSEFISSITFHISCVVSSINSSLQLLSSLILGIAIFLGLFTVDWQITCFAALSLASVYSILAIICKNKLMENSVRIASRSKIMIQQVQEGLGAIRNIILDSNQEYYARAYDINDRRLRILQSESQFLTTFPRYGLESLSLVVIALLGYYLVILQNMQQAIQILGVFALGSQKLLPSLQLIYRGWAQIQGFNADVEIISEIYCQYKVPSKQKQDISVSASYQMSSHINVDNVSFNYGSSSGELALKDISFSICKGDIVGIVGKTGSGKSTLVDLLMCLLMPTKGQISIDGRDIYSPENSDVLKCWKQSISHVPQSIFLSDTTILNNVAFGIPEINIDYEMARVACKLAQIDEYIMTCEDGYRTLVGERGLRLSGGQVQRIGIARALYKKCSILVLDEATSALDSATESKVIDSIIHNLQPISIIMISHRPLTLKRCNKFLTLDKGKLVVSKTL